MDDSSDYGRRFPPRSKFNDEEATAILRLMIEQEKLLKNATVSPVLNVSSNRLQRLPPLHPKRSESLDENDLENVRTRKSSGKRDYGLESTFPNEPSLLQDKDSRSLSDKELPGKPTRIPDICSNSPKIAKPHRDRSDRPKGSYGRTTNRPAHHESEQTSSNSDEESAVRENGYMTTGKDYKEELSRIATVRRYSPSYIN